MNNTLGNAIVNGYTQTGKPSEFLLNYNPTYGIIPDLVQCLVLKVGELTGLAKSTGIFNDKVITARGEDGSNMANHSQGNQMAYAGAQYIYKSKVPGAMANPGGAQSPPDPTDYDHTASAYGSPVNGEKLKTVFNKAGMTLMATITNENDFVGEVLGGNKGINGQAPLIDHLNLLNLGRLPFSSSPHGSYACRPPAVCGDKP